MEQWNNVELSDLSKKSYTLNHEYDAPSKHSKPRKNSSYNNNNDHETNDAVTITTTAAETTQSTTTTENSNGSHHGAALLQPGSDIKPKISLEDVESLVRRLYGITTSEVKELISYDDRNFFIQEDRNIKNPLIVSHWPHGYVLKILNSLDSKKTDFVDAQNQLMIYLSKQQIQCPKPIANAYGKYYSVESIKGAEHVVRLLEFIPGKMFHQVEKTNHLLFQSGEYIAKVDRALKNFAHEAYETHKTLWMLQSITQLKDFVYVLKDHGRKALVEEIITAFETDVLSKLDKFEQQIIHGDFNEQNIIVDQPKGQSEYKVTAVIDFGDTNRGPIIFEIGIAMTYMMLQAKSLESGGIFLAGYTAIRPITAAEKDCLKYCVAARLAQSLVMGAYTHSLDPSNDYVLVTQDDGWKLIEQLWRESFESIDELWQTTADKYLTASVK